jgi:hypothetical protein
VPQRRAPAGHWPTVWSRWAELPLSECVRCAQRNAMAMAMAMATAMATATATATATARQCAVRQRLRNSRGGGSCCQRIDGSECHEAQPCAVRADRQQRHTVQAVHRPSDSARFRGKFPDRWDSAAKRCDTARTCVCTRERSLTDARDALSNCGNSQLWTSAVKYSSSLEYCDPPARAPAPSSPVGPAADVGRNAPRPGGGMR